MRGENGSRFLPRTVPTTTTNPIFNHNRAKWPSEAAYSPRVIEVGYEALFSYDLYVIAAIAEKGRAIRTIAIVVILAAIRKNSLISSAILAMIYPIEEELFIYSKCDC